MNALSYRYTLPLDWNGTASGLHRRRHIGDVTVSDSAVDTLNRVIENVDGSLPALSSDSIVSCGRRLLRDSPEADDMPSACILERLRTVALMDAMVKDFDWSIDDVAAYRVALMLDYVRRHEELIPHDAPKVGHLDDAILVESAGRSVLPELADYNDYRRLRKIEAFRQGIDLAAYRYFRDDWLESRAAERALLKLQREVALSSFQAESQARMFKIH